MIALPPGARVWLAGGVTDMRKGMNGLTLLVQEGLGRDPHAGTGREQPPPQKLPDCGLRRMVTSEVSRAVQIRRLTTARQSETITNHTVN